MRADIVIASYRKDLPWLKFNLQFLAKYWTDSDSKIIVRLDEDCKEIVDRWKGPAFCNPRLFYFYVTPWPDGYHFHMFLKMTSDAYTDSELIICVDSDVILLEAARLANLMEDGKPIIYYLEWADADPMSEKKWRSGTSQIMGMDLDRDYMVTTPFVFWRSTFAGARRRIEETTGKSFEQAVYSKRPYNYMEFLDHPMIYADYEALGLYGAKFEPDRYVVKPRPVRNWPFQLFWSHGYSSQIESLLRSKLVT